jgi:hypothetical protein
MGEAARVLPAAGMALSHDDVSGPLTLVERVALVRPPCFWPALPGKPPLSLAERAGVIRLAQSIPGQGDDETMVALVEAMRHAPAGDVVAVGAGRGRLATLLAWLARRYQIGPVLCLDAWSEASLAEFEVAVAPLAEGRLNWMRTEAASSYTAEIAVTTKTFGETRYEGRIALLHLASREADADFWTPRVVPGGWIVFGEAQTAASETFVQAHRDRICAKFRAGEALFVQLKR